MQRDKVVYQLNVALPQMHTDLQVRPLKLPVNEIERFLLLRAEDKPFVLAGVDGYTGPAAMEDAADPAEYRGPMRHDGRIPWRTLVPAMMEEPLDQWRQQIGAQCQDFVI